MKIPFQPINREHKFLKNKLVCAFETQINKSRFILDSEVKKFEKNFAAFLGSKYVIGVGNGFDALKISLLSLGVKNGDEVLVPTNSFIASALAINATGADPIFVDSNESFGINITDLKKKISKKTKAVILVHLYGIPDDINEVILICKNRNIKIIEDCAQAHGALLNNKKIGTFGDLGTFSFYPTKNLGALGDGGCIATNSKNLMKIAKSLSNYGSFANNDYSLFGFNSRLDEMQAHFLNIKLPFLNKWNDIRQKHAQIYFEYLNNILELTLPTEDKNKTIVWHHFPIRCVKKNRDKLRLFLKNRGVETGIHYEKPIHKTKTYIKNKIRLRISEKISSELITLPINPFHTEREIKYIAKSIKLFFNN